ncbi:hypothetical protein [Thiocystis violascens]|uniref:Uncharacterized protein n=1 Tax=Thiocystis violascens (strain ATCC 17096 / DSM 198 / 6111) TaxID=765911 RepID=I3Y6L3_THIV6|nr:hypothetical protein [Thiocystis violascens]AFL72631.1 hypothetical protein Thivi_0573 [Thiocystis violascens DSM 198]
MSMQVSWYRVERIQVSANGALLSDGSQTMCWWQELELFDPQDALIGRIVLHLTSPKVALPVGEQPPYWGIDPRQTGALALLDGEAPF